MKMTDEMRLEHRRAASRKFAERERRANFEFRNNLKLAGITLVSDVPSRPTRTMMEEAWKRMNAPHRTLGSQVFGDPPVGYSALDQRNSDKHTA